MYLSRRFVLVSLRRNPREDLNTKLQWFGNSLGLFNLRDKDKSCFRIFIQLLSAAKHNAGLSSDELAFQLKLSRGTVIHHLNKLLEAGIAVEDDGKYFLRVSNLESLVDELEKDAVRALNDLRKAAQEIDNGLDL